jgi:GR25 family glycosyltransferase involved in LPS biosynthesis
MGLLFSIKRAIRSIQMCLIFSFWFGFGLYGRIYDYETPTTRYLRDIEISELDSGMAGIDCIYVINLDDRPKKWKMMQDILNGFHLRANRVPAVNGWALTKRAKNALLGSYRRRARMNGGQIGCLLSHVSIMKDAYNRGFEKIWIMEDDIRFNESPQVLPALLEELTQLDPGWDVFYTDTDAWRKLNIDATTLRKDNFFRPDQTYHSFDFYASRDRISSNILTMRHRHGLYSYVVSKKGIEKLLNYFNHTYIWSAIDYDIHYIPCIRQYAFSREMTYPDVMISDTSKPIERGDP